MVSWTYGGGPQNGQPQWSSGGGIGEERGEPQRTCGGGLNEGSRILAPWSLLVHQIRLAAAVSPKAGGCLPECDICGFEIRMLFSAVVPALRAYQQGQKL